MKKFLTTLMAGMLTVGAAVSLGACDKNTIYVDTNAFFAPFEYYVGDEIKDLLD